MFASLLDRLCGVLNTLYNTFYFVFWTLDLLLNGVSGMCKVLTVVGVTFMFAPDMFDPFFLNGYEAVIPLELQHQFLVLVASLGILLCAVGPHHLHIVCLGLIPSVLLHYNASSQGWTMVGGVLVLALLAYLYGERLIATVFSIIGALIGAWLCAALAHVASNASLDTQYMTVPVLGFQTLSNDILALHDTVDVMLAVTTNPTTRFIIKLLIVTYLNWVLIVAAAVAFRFVKRFDFVFASASASASAAGSGALELDNLTGFLHKEIIGPVLVSYMTLLQSVIVFLSVALVSKLSSNRTFALMMSTLFGSWITAFALAHLFEMPHVQVSLFTTLLVVLWLPRIIRLMFFNTTTKSTKSTKSSAAQE
jgi:hypothetical protein